MFKQMLATNAEQRPDSGDEDDEVSRMNLGPAECAAKTAPKEGGSSKLGSSKTAPQEGGILARRYRMARSGSSGTEFIRPASSSSWATPHAASTEKPLPPANISSNCDLATPDSSPEPVVGGMGRARFFDGDVADMETALWASACTDRTKDVTAEYDWGYLWASLNAVHPAAGSMFNRREPTSWEDATAVPDPRGRDRLEFKRRDRITGRVLSTGSGDRTQQTTIPVIERERTRDMTSAARKFAQKIIDDPFRISGALGGGSFKPSLHSLQSIAFWDGKGIQIDKNHSPEDLMRRAIESSASNYLSTSADSFHNVLTNVGTMYQFVGKGDEMSDMIDALEVEERGGPGPAGASTPQTGGGTDGDAASSSGADKDRGGAGSPRISRVPGLHGRDDGAGPSNSQSDTSV